MRLQQEVEESLTDANHLKSEKELFISKLKSDGLRNRRLSDLPGKGETLMAQAEAVKQQNNSFHNDYFKSRAKVLRDRICGNVTKLRTTFGVDYDLPSDSRKDLEWAGLDLLGATQALAANTFTQNKRLGQVDTDTCVKPAASTPHVRSDSLFGTSSQGQKSSTSQNFELETTLSHIESAINQKTVGGRYVPNQSSALKNTRANGNNQRSQTSVVNQLELETGDSDNSIEHNCTIPEQTSSAEVRSRDCQPRASLKLPKMSFDGTYWRGFLSQFEAYARRMSWSEEDKIDAFSMCLRKEASEYFSVLPNTVKESFTELKSKFEQYFKRNDSPSTIRWEILSTKQREDESLEKYLARLQKLILSAYPDSKQVEMNTSLFIEAFLKGCRDKTAAVAAGVKRPSTLEEAYR